MKSILITGASGGFGREVAVMLAKKGWRVFASMRDPGKRDRVLELASAVGAPLSAFEFIELDVASDASRAEAVEEVLRRSDGELTALLHNAGYTTTGFFEDVPPDRLRHLVETNLLGAMDLTRRLLPALRRCGRARLAVVSSNAVNVPHPMFSVYAATKWALEGWCEALAVELRPFGVDVVVFQPGNHDTGFGAATVPALPESSAYAEYAGRALPKLTGLGRYSRPSYRASARICAVLEQERPPLRSRLGADDVVASWAARLLPYRMRRRAVERITGLG
ncbi:SDR family oxidoreductase [Amycolatopsis circi]|uniref:SDR family oxidoreductase n=1 Tax=Amycolatopsis circi TaxID=871959 RepID=UPI000E2777F1|nr:SDR family oxidoreductase [Amycolatopsis circi]